MRVQERVQERDMAFSMAQCDVVKLHGLHGVFYRYKKERGGGGINREKLVDGRMPTVLPV